MTTRYSLDLRKLDMRHLTLIRNNIAEIKSSINEIRNTHDRMSSGMEEAEEQISDLEDGVMEHNQVEQKRVKTIT